MTVENYNYLVKIVKNFEKCFAIQKIVLPLHRFRRDGRVVDYSGLENRRTERYRGFESLSLRNELKLKEKRKPNGFRFLFYQVWIGKLA